MTGGDAIVEVTATDPEAGTCQGRWDSFLCGFDECFGGWLVDPGDGWQFRWGGSAMPQPGGVGGSASRCAVSWPGISAPAAGPPTAVSDRTGRCVHCARRPSRGRLPPPSWRKAVGLQQHPVRPIHPRAKNQL